MKNIVGIALLAIALSLPIGGAYATPQRDPLDPNNCPARGHPDRTLCLERLKREGQVEIDRSSAYLDSLNRSMSRTCAVAETADAAARAAGGTTGTVRAIGKTWTSSRALADFALGQRRECEKLRRELRR